MLKLDNFFNKGKEKLVFPKQTKINCEVFNIEVTFIKKKNSSVVVKEDKLIFRLSKYLRENQIKSHFDSLLKSISLKIERMDLKAVKNTFTSFIEKSSFNFNDSKYRIEFSNKIAGVRYKENIFYINPTLDVVTIEKRVIKKILNLYEEEMDKYVRDINRRTFNFHINGFKLKNLDSKWGHCTSKNDIMLNAKLLNSSKEILDYVIIHELAHIKVKSHSLTFWREVEKFCPNHKMLRKELRLNPPKLFK